MVHTGLHERWVLRPAQRARQHGAVLQPAARRGLERAGWRTTLDYRENHVRSLDGRLLRVESVWTAVAERYEGDVAVASADGATADEAWARLREEVDAERVQTLQFVRLAR